MSEITREEVNQYFQRAVESWERRAEWCADRAAHGDISAAKARDAALHTAAIYRLALAALEDAERVDALAYDLEGGPIFDEYAKHDVHEIAATDAHIETDERGAYCRAFRAAIDRARGVVTDGR